MITVQQIDELGAGEACARECNNKGFAVASLDAFERLFPGASPGAYQPVTHDGSTINICTPNAGVPPDAFPD